MALDPRTPVIVGVGQSLRRPDDVATASEPAEMMAEVARLAADDSGVGPKLLERADSVRIMQLLSWRYPNPGLAVSERIGAAPSDTVVTTVGGNSPQMVVDDTAEAILRGDVNVAVVAGAEAMYTRRRARRDKLWLDWPPQADDVAAPRVLGDDRAGTNDVEMSRSLALPTQIYPIFENALRAAAGESIDVHQRKIAELWSRFSRVAAENPYAWTPVARTAEEIATASADNRMIGFPYTKYMNANLDTDQAAAFVMCSAEAADELGVSSDKWVFPLAGAEAHDHWFVSDRADLHSSPAIAAAGRAAFGLAGISADAVAHVDLYSCFPSAVQMGAAALGFELDRQLTVTGGLPFAGGPGNNYSTHAIAAMVDVLRRDPGSIGLVTALGWYATKHAVGLYSTEPPASGFRCAHPQDEVDRLPGRELVADHDGPATVESYTVMHARDGSPELGLVACLLDDGRRTWANVRDPAVLQQMVSEEFCGTRVALRAGGDLSIAR